MTFIKVYHLLDQEEKDPYYINVNQITFYKNGLIGLPGRKFPIEVKLTTEEIEELLLEEE